jgi:hypothetical protein
MKKPSVIIIVLFLVVACENKKVDRIVPLPKLSLHLEELNYWLYDPIINKPINDILDDTSRIEINLKDYKGALTFQIFNNKGELVRTGAYVDALAVFNYYILLYKVSGEGTMKVKQCYQPLPDGTWLTFSKNKIINTRRFRKGVEIIESLR